ncbi:MAG: Crp/Fnr family transcriptional regulator [Ktedonobacteraceae bacterium]
MARQTDHENHVVLAYHTMHLQELAGLRTTPLFAALREQDLIRLAQESSRQAYGSGEIIPPRDADEVLIVAQGSIRLTIVSSQGRELLLWRRAVGEVCKFGVLETALPGDALAQAEADGSILYSLPCPAFLGIVCSQPAGLVSLAQLLCREAEREVRLIHDLAFSSIRRRVAHHLAELARPEGSRQVVRTTHAEVAALVGTRPEEVTKALAALLREGLIHYLPHGRVITLRQHERLRTY